MISGAPLLDLVGRLVLGLAGASLVVWALSSAVRTLVLPRSAPDALVRTVFKSMRSLFRLRLRTADDYAEVDRVMAFYAPVSLLALVPVWLAVVLLGFAGIYAAIGAGTPYQVMQLSGSSLLTLGTAPLTSPLVSGLAFAEAAIGLMLGALLIAYLPTMYGAFSQREAAVAMLDVRAGSPPSAVEMFARYHRLGQLQRLGELWAGWETWFAQLEETHTSLPVLAFYRSPQADRSWVIAAGTVLDAASLSLAALDLANDTQARLCIRGGFIALRRIADYFDIPYDPNPSADDPISITRQEFEAACQQLSDQGIPVSPDLDQAWRDFAGWRVNYDAVLLALARLTEAPPAPWTSDRSPLPHVARKSAV